MSQPQRWLRLVPLTEVAAMPEPEAVPPPQHPLAGPLATATLALSIYHAMNDTGRRYRLPYELAIKGLVTFEEADEMILVLYLHDLAKGRAG